MRVLAPGGVLAMSLLLEPGERQDFFLAVNRAAEQTGRPLTEIERTGHALDHPIGFPEGAYLKCLFATAP